MWLRSDKRELRVRNQQKTTLLFNNHRKKRKRNQYSKTIKLMKTEKKASVLKATQYSTDDLTLYNDKSIKAKKQQNVKKQSSYIESLSFTSDTNQFGPIKFDLNTIDIDINIRTSNSLAAESQTIVEYEHHHHENASENFHQTLDTQFTFDCSSKTATELQSVADMILKRKFDCLLNSIFI